MATQTLLQENTLALTGIVRRWDRRLRLSQMLRWFPRSLLPGLAVGLALAVVSHLRPWLLPQQIALVTVALVALGIVIFTLGVWLWRRPALTSARRFDVQFELGERVSTALELGSGVIRSSDELIERQLADARATASAVKVRDYIPLELRGRDWAIAVLMTALLVLLLIIPNPQVDALNNASAQRTAIDEAADDMRELTQDVAADASLGDEERETLLEALQTTTNRLEQPNITPEEAFAAVSDVRSELQERANDLSSQSSQNQSALEQAAAALRQAAQQGDASEANSGSPTGTMQQVEQDMQQLASEASEMSAEERQQASEALRQAAQALQQTNPQASESLQQAAEQMQQPTGDPQPQLQQAQQQMQQQSQQAQQQQQQASENLSEASEQAQQAAQQISESQQQQSQQSGEQQSQEQQAQEQQEQQQSQQSEEQGQQSQSSQQQSQSGQQSDQGQETTDGQAQQQSQGSQQSDQAQQSQNQTSQGQQQSQQGAPSQAQSASAGNQAGDSGSDDVNGQSQASQNQSDTSNNPDGEGVGQYESVNVPQRIGQQGNDGNNVQLDPDAGNAPVQEGDFSQNPDGQVTVPYNQVFSDYANSANEALESDYVPLGLRDVVRDYFTSLEPRR